MIFSHKAALPLLLIALTLGGLSCPPAALPEEDTVSQADASRSADRTSLPASGSADTSHEDPIAPVLIVLAVILAAAKAGGELFERIGQPSVLGELVMGVVLGNLGLFHSSLAFFEPLRGDQITAHWAVVIDGLSRLGVILLLFEVGLESNLGEMRKVGVSSFLVATVGVVAPFFLGYAVSWLFIKQVPPVILAASPRFDLANIHMFVGATLCATSVGITARVFKDLNKLHLREARIILGAAVIDDVFGLLILAVVSGIIAAAETGGSVSAVDILQLTGLAMGFLLGAGILGLVAVPKMIVRFARMRTGGIMIIVAVLFCFLLSFAANAAGLATIVGAFAAGLILEEVHFSEFREKRSLGELLSPVTTLLVPVFFILMGMRVRLETFLDAHVMGVAAGLSLAAFAGKQVCGLAVVEKRLDRLSIGLGMVPRGEVGLIFASIGKSLNVIDDALFSAIVAMVIVTTFSTPPLLKISLGRFQRKQLAPPASP